MIPRFSVDIHRAFFGHRAGIVFDGHPFAGGIAAVGRFAQDEERGPVAEGE